MQLPKTSWKLRINCSKTIVQKTSQSNTFEEDILLGKLAPFKHYPNINFDASIVLPGELPNVITFDRWYSKDPYNKYLLFLLVQGLSY